MSSEKQYIDLYQEQRNIIFEHSSDVMNALRDKAFEDFERKGFPTKKVERYRYVDIPGIFQRNYGLNLKRLNLPFDAYHAFKCAVPRLVTYLYLIHNDTFHARHSVQARLPEGVIIDSLSHAAAKHPELVGKYYGKEARTDADSLTALNTMFAQDGIFIHVEKNVRLDKAVQIVNLMGAGIDLMANRRVIIALEEGAEATFLFCDHTLDPRNFMSLQVTEVFVGENASLDVYNLEETNSKTVHINNTCVRQLANSRFNHNEITLHNGMTRNQLDLVFSGGGAECQCNGCVIASGKQHVDNNTLIEHKVPHCTSGELYKYVLDDQAVGAFSGLVLVGHGARKTVSRETNQNLLATAEARMYSQPMLEIYADDVVCSHGSTVGQLNDAALFYMEQRGVDREEAKLLLEFAFLNEVIDNIKLGPLKERLRVLIEQRFRGTMGKCLDF